MTALVLATVTVADDPAVKVPGACSVIPVTLPDADELLEAELSAARDTLSGALKVP